MCLFLGKAHLVASPLSGRSQSLNLTRYTVRLVSASLRNERVERRGLGTRPGRVHTSVKREQEERKPPPRAEALSAASPAPLSTSITSPVGFWIWRLVCKEEASFHSTFPRFAPLSLVPNITHEFPTPVRTASQSHPVTLPTLLSVMTTPIPHISYSYLCFLLACQPTRMQSVYPGGPRYLAQCLLRAGAGVVLSGVLLVEMLSCLLELLLH